MANPFSSRFTRPGVLAYRYRAVANDAAVESKGRGDFVARWIQTLRRNRFGLIVGPHGTGKSTLLHDVTPELQSEFPGGQWVQLTGDPRAGFFERWLSRRENARAVLRVQRQVAPGGVLVVDGGEQLWSWARFRLRRRIRTAQQFCLMTAHRDLAGFVTIHRTEANENVIRELLRELLKQHPAAESCFQIDSRDPGRLILRLPDGSKQIVALDQVTDVRELWSQLYDVVGRAAVTTEIPRSEN
ncbi:ATP-binding protein [Rhodopirellula sp. JC740]|uniref:ATP-binding protein n=1 Tax=Rhodopirellula halodulae TaxID=2894198 RepID=A0ABS8NBV6_9BACT|nr:ATP-binding protein [Rhodopirellula sp. JC740]